MCVCACVCVRAMMQRNAKEKVLVAVNKPENSQFFYNV